MKIIKLKSLIEAKNILSEKTRRGDEQDVRGALGRPYDDYIASPVEVFDHEQTQGVKGATGFTYKWKLQIPIEDISSFKDLKNRTEKTMEERLMAAIADKLATEPDSRDGQYTSGTADVKDRIEKNNKKYIVIAVEMVVGYDK